MLNYVLVIKAFAQPFQGDKWCQRGCLSHLCYSLYPGGHADRTVTEKRLLKQIGLLMANAQNQLRRQKKKRA